MLCVGSLNNFRYFSGQICWLLFLKIACVFLFRVLWSDFGFVPLLLCFSFLLLYLQSHNKNIKTTTTIKVRRRVTFSCQLSISCKWNENIIFPFCFCCFPVSHRNICTSATFPHILHNVFELLFCVLWPVGWKKGSMLEFMHILCFCQNKTKSKSQKKRKSK